MFSLAGKLLVTSIAGVTPVATIIFVATTALSAPPRQEHKLTRENFISPFQNSGITEIKKEQEIEEKEHNNCQDKNIKVIIQNSQGQELTVPVTELSKYKDYKPIDVEYRIGTCSREKANQ